MRSMSFPRVRRLNITKMSIILKLVRRLKAIRIKIPEFLLKTDRLILEVPRNQRTNSQNYSDKKKIKPTNSDDLHYFIWKLIIKLTRVLVRLNIQINGIE